CTSAAGKQSDDAWNSNDVVAAALRRRATRAPTERGDYNACALAPIALLDSPMRGFDERADPFRIDGIEQLTTDLERRAHDHAVGHTGASSRNDQRIGQSALQGVVRRVFDLEIPKRDSMFDMHVGKNGCGRANSFAVADGSVGVALDDALVGEHRAGVNVDADE